jgi:VanZ family protein
MLFILGSMPSSGTLFLPPWDKLAHFIFFAFLTLNTYLAFPNTRPSLCIIWIIGIGALDEVHQIFLPFRHAGADDWGADLLGTLSMATFIHWNHFLKR